MYDAPDNQVVYLHAFCISRKPNRTLSYHGTHRAPDGILTYLFFTGDMYESIY